MKKPSRSLELGCGNGRVCLQLAGMGYYIDGVDSSASAIEKLVNRISQNPKLGDKVNAYHGNFLLPAANIPDSYDLVLLSDLTVNLFDEEGLIIVLRQVKNRFLNDQGIFAFSIFHKDSIPHLQKYQGQVFTNVLNDDESKPRLLWQTALFSATEQTLTETWFIEQRNLNSLGYASFLIHHLWTLERIEPILKAQGFKTARCLSSKIEGGGAAELEVLTLICSLG